MVLFDLRALADAPELDERVARIALVLSLHDVGVVLGVDEPELRELRIGQEVERDKVGSGLFERRKLFLERRLRTALEGSDTLPDA